MSRLIPLLATALFLHSCSPLNKPGMAEKAPPPNILLIIADDASASSFGAY